MDADWNPRAITALETKGLESDDTECFVLTVGLWRKTNFIAHFCQSEWMGICSDRDFSDVSLIYGYEKITHLYFSYRWINSLQCVQDINHYGTSFRIIYVLAHFKNVALYIRILKVVS